MAVLIFPTSLNGDFVFMNVLGAPRYITVPSFNPFTKSGQLSLWVSEPPRKTQAGYCERLLQYDKPWVEDDRLPDVCTRAGRSVPPE